MDSCLKREEKPDDRLLKPPNVYLVGAQCTGKTTLLKALQTHFADAKTRDFHGQHVEPPAIIEEVVREVMRNKDFNVNDIRKPDRGLELQQCTLQAQFNAEEALKDRWFISDRSGLDAIVYAQVYLGPTAAVMLTESREWDVLRLRMRGAVVIVCEAGNTEWLSGDNVRITYKNTGEWEDLNREFHNALRQHAIEYIVLPKEMRDLQQRLFFVERALRTDVTRE